ncbi:MAG: class I SAM-dependent methyltransferase [Methanosarcinales archaeon]|nr:class I SAM-dependent methyltransferase [Methanosarcinales archaeon]
MRCWGAGLILNAASTYIEKNYGAQINKFALDLSPGMLKIQNERNVDLKKALNEDICKTSLGDKEIDLTLMIDVLEHVPNPTKALEEVKRISKFIILKVPLENNILLNTMDFITKGKVRQELIETVGHINVYNFNKLNYEIEKHAGYVLDSYYTNVFDYVKNSEHYKNKMSTRFKLMNFVAGHTFKASPKLSSIVFSDFAMILVKCY